MMVILIAALAGLALWAGLAAPTRPARAPGALRRVPIPVRAAPRGRRPR